MNQNKTKMMKVKRRRDSIYTKDEDIWITKEFCQGNTAIKVSEKKRPESFWTFKKNLRNFMH